MKLLVISDYRETVSVRPEAELFIGLKKAGVDVEIMTYGDAEYVKKFRAANIRVIDFHPEKKLDRKEIKRIRQELINGQHDIIHLFNSKAIINGIQAAKNLSVKIILYRGYMGNINWYDPTAYFKYLHPKVDKIWCTVESNKQYIQQQLFFDKDRPITIHKGHDLSWYKNITAIKRSELPNIPPSAFWITNVANNRKMKGIPYLLKAMDFIPPELPVHLLLIGKNLDNKENINLVNNSPNKNKIHFLGYRTDVLGIVKTSDVFVLSSIFGEGTTKAVIEAMSLGTTPVITDIPGNKGLVIDKECGIVVPPKDANAIANAILKLFNDNKLNKKYGKKATQHINEKFNIHTTVSEMKKLYESLLKN